MDAPRPGTRRRAGWVLSSLVAPVALAEAVLLGLEPMPLFWLHRVLPGLFSLASLSGLVWAFVPGRLARGVGVISAAAIGVACAVVSGLEPAGLAGLQLGLHLSSAAALIGGAALVTEARRPRGPRRILDEQVLVVDGKSAKKTSARELVAGQEVRPVPGSTSLPVDGRVTLGAAHVHLASLYRGARVVTKKQGDVVLAGSRVEGELHIEVARPPEHTLFAQVRRRTATMIDELARPDRVDGASFAFVALCALGATVLSLSNAPLMDWLSRARIIGVTALLASSAPAALVRFRTRARLIELLAAGGVYLGSASDLSRLIGFRRLAIAPELASGPGEVELEPRAEISQEDLLGVAAALFAGDEGPIAVTLRAELERRGLGELRSAAERRTQAVFHGTVGGVRWFVGPALAVEMEEKLRLDEATAAAHAALSDRWPIVLVLGRPDRGLVGLLGVSMGENEIVAELGRTFGANLLPGQPDVVREAIGRSSGLSVRARPMKGRDVALLRFRDLPPSAGLSLRVAEELDLLGHELGEFTIVAEPALPSLAETLALARRLQTLGRLRTGACLLAPLVAFGLVLAWPAFPPLFGAAFGLGLAAIAAAS